MTDKEKFNLAVLARMQSYSPYSKFKVGAVLIFADGSYVLGCNVENASYGLSMCAERNAIFSSVAQGKDPHEIVELICLADSPKPVSPCGACRQVMSEFFKPDTKITLFNMQQEKEEFLFKDLLPYSFSSEDLN